MRRSKSEIYLHLVWATGKREPIISSDIERAVHRCIEEQAKSLGCEVLAVNGMPNHVHLAVKIPGKLSASELAKQVKGVSSHFIHERFPQLENFAWQEGYAAFSICRSHVKTVIDYVERQKEHHAEGKTWQSLEEVDEETPGKQGFSVR